MKQSINLIKPRIDELIVEISKKKRSLFLYEISNRHYSILSPSLWESAIDEIPAFWAEVEIYFIKWKNKLVEENSYKATILTISVVFMFLVVIFYLIYKNSIWQGIDNYFYNDGNYTAIDKRRRAALKSFSDLILFSLASFIIYRVGKEFGLINDHNNLFFIRLLFGITITVFFIKYIKSAFSPNTGKWRIINCNDSYAKKIVKVLSLIFVLYILERVPVTGIELTLEGGIDLIQLISGVFSFIVLVLVLWLTKKNIWINTIVSSEEGDKNPQEKKLKLRYEIIRKVFRLIGLILIAAIFLGYIRLSEFLVIRFILLSFLLVFYISLRELLIWGIASLQAFGASYKSKYESEESDETESSAEFWIKVIVDLSLPFVLFPVLLILLGFDRLDIKRIYSFFDSNINIGAVSFSISNLIYGFIVFLIVIIVTRWISSLFNKRILGPAHFDPGLKNSMMTLSNYFGILLAIILSLATIGIDFSKIAIIAGALSVGIGFGLQSIVSNFVSGLILLFERPIKIGDWVVVNSGEGYVKHIGARATHIQTFDQSTIIIPNSELISNSLTNWFFNNRRGRVIVPVGVAYSSDPEKVKNILTDVAMNHPSVLKVPPVTIYWSDFGDSSLNFEVRAFIKNYDEVLSVKTDLRFAIFQKLKEEGVTIPFPQRDVNFYPQEKAQHSSKETEITPHKRTKGTKGE
nr:DUF3772 domain-containing protein [Mangrovivirga halotolerans]